MFKKYFFFFILILVLGACSSKTGEKIRKYRDVYAQGDFEKAQSLLDSSGLKKEKNSELLWHLEKGTLALARGDENTAIVDFQTSLDLIDRLFTTKLTKKAASLFINDASDDFYGASYERSYAHYFLAKAYYQRYQKTKTKLDLQGARGTILAWDSYFAELQRSASAKTIYQTDLMLKVFGGQIHEVSEISNDKQIALQLYKDALRILELQGGAFSLFNSKSADYVKTYEEAVKEDKAPSQKNYDKTAAYQDLKNYLHYKVLSLTKEIRGSDFAVQLKSLSPQSDVLKKVETGKSNVTIVIEEGLVPAKVGKPFNFGIKGAMAATDDKKVQSFIATVGSDLIASFAMNKLGMAPSNTSNPGSFLFAHQVTKLAVQEAAVEFELPMIENVPLVQRLQVFVLDSKGVIIAQSPLPVISENGDIARIVLEEDVVSRYVKTGTRVALKHLTAIVAAMTVYQTINGKNGNGGDFLAKAAALATYVGASKGIAMFEKADTRYWSTLPQALRMMEFKLAPGDYEIGIALYTGDKAPAAPSKVLGKVAVDKSGKTINILTFSKL